ncbi:MAG TPA: hypothetical protein VGQ11_09165 [Candidatus Acidoferrales bacterium]|nr:hypothetical protein [Candidatus Acidoferrales bacterium]
MPATRRLVLIIIVLFFLLLFFVVPSVSWSQTPPSPWQESAREFSKKIAALTGTRQTVTLSVRNISSLSDTEVAAVRAALETELRAAGLRLAAKSIAAPELRITFSENLQGLLWIAEILRDDSRDVAMLSVGKGSAPAAVAATQMFVLQSALIFEQDEPILDFVFLDAERLILLEPWKLVSLTKIDSSWHLHQTVELPYPKVSSRDPRPFLTVDDVVLLVFVPDHVCRAEIESTLKLHCWDREQGTSALSDAGMILLGMRPVSGRNYYRGLSRIFGDATSREDVYYDFAALLERGISGRVTATIDGKAVLTRSDSGKVSTTTISGWGSQLKGILSQCGMGSQLLVTGPGDWTEADSVQAFEFEGTTPLAVSNSIRFPGPVPELQGGTAARSVHAIVQNLKTGRYEAYTLTLSCGR